MKFVPCTYTKLLFYLFSLSIVFTCIMICYPIFYQNIVKNNVHSKKKLEIRDNEIQQNFLLFILIMHVRHIKYKIKSIVCFTPCLEGEGEHIVLALSVRPFVRNKFSQDDKHLIFGVQPQLVVTCRA